MPQTAKNKNGVAGPVVLMVFATMTAAWFAYSMLFPQDVITFLVTLIYFPMVGVICFVLYGRLRNRT